MSLEEFKSQVTVSFSGYNILRNIKWAINSFLYFHPDMKDNIVVFDDESTDGTKEWLNSVGIKRISWSERFLPYKEKAGKIREIAAEKSFSYHCSLMVSDIMHQTNSKYLLLNDGDIVFLNNVVEKYYSHFPENKGAFIVLPFMNKAIEGNTYKDLGREADKYKILLRSVSASQEKFLHRIHAYHALFDLEYFKEVNLLFDDYDSPFVIKGLNYPGIPIDSGLDFYYHVTKNRISFKPLHSQFTSNNTDVFHFGLVSSHKRLRELNSELIDAEAVWLKGELDKYFNKVVNLKEFLNNPNIIDHLG